MSEKNNWLMPICRLAYADFKMAYADTFIGRFVVLGLLTSMRLAR